ncbi:uncharacterized protein LOC107360688 isoform X2 [Tetranychus urticae]|uniref:uncharacterized protein LOC107360688 isoform X2 n=1 Tax=Tetranychus urticae TaxID=32264 RepID=UPI000D64BD62|nr:uncharacterized protein LOC107360688 isoform X2 [Tetranychus urticae]
MLINELPDDCLLTIFDCIQDLTDLVNCFKVCKKWCNLIVVRTKKVKYFIDRPNNLPDSVCHLSDELIDVTFLCKWFPNLRIVDFCKCGDMSPAEAVELIRDSESLKGTITSINVLFWIGSADLSRLLMNANLEMFSTELLFFDTSLIHEHVKQLHLPHPNTFLPKDAAHTFPNLERLNICCVTESGDNYSNGPVMANLKIIELRLNSNDWEDPCRIFEVMDSCPALQSAHIINVFFNQMG